MDRRSIYFVMLLLFYSAFIQFGFNQSNFSLSKVDSIQALIKIDEEDTNKVNHLIQLGEELVGTNPDTAIVLTKKALELATNIASSKIAANNKNVMRSAQNGVIRSSGRLGVYYYLKGDYSVSLQYHFKALELREAFKDKDGMCNSYNNIGNVYRFQGDHTNALEYYFKALKLNVELGNKNKIASNLNNIGLVYFDIRDYKFALEYYNKSLKLNEQLEDKNEIAKNLNNIGIVYYSEGDLTNALKYYFKALQVNEELANISETANNLGNIGATYYKDNNYPMALEYYSKALKLNEELGTKYFIAANLGNIGHIYVIQKKYSEAEDHLIRALKISNEIGALEFIAEDNKLLSDLYSQTSRFELAFNHYQDYSTAKDSLFNNEKSKEIGRLEMQHEIEKAEKERLDKAEAKMKTELQQRQRKNTLQYSGIVVVLLIISVLVTVLGFIKVKPSVASAVVFFAFLLFFEFMMVLLDPTVNKLSGGEPAYSLLLNALIAVCIFPIHAFFERILKRRLIKDPIK